jgi:cyclopropane fatty-acyl-phospholipid synthase-like methyltransferase
MSEPELERWNSRYAAADYLFGTAPNDFLASQRSRLRAGQRALCVADGEGRNSVWLAEQGLEVTAFDFSPAGVEKARRLAAQRGVRAHYDVSTVYDWAWPESAFDVVAAIFVQFADPPMRDFMFERMVRALVPGGLVFLIGYTPKQRQYDTGGPKQVDQLYTEPMLREAFKALEILELREYEADLAEGSRHQGRSALIHLVARKKAGTTPMRTIMARAALGAVVRGA